MNAAQTKDVLPAVALRKESVDRNTNQEDGIWELFASLSARRAWIEIAYVLVPSRRILASLSARRAWIEISMPLTRSSQYNVALRKESVDRNFVVFNRVHNGRVALRKESVDRNKIGIKAIDSVIGRSPQGERG